MTLLRKLTCKILLSAFLLIALNNAVKAQTALVAGDIVFTGYIARGPSTTTDAFSFVLLKAVVQNTTIRFTDYGWRTATNSFNSGGASTETEAVLLVTNPAGFPAGTEIKIENLSANLVGGGSAGTLTFSTGLAPDGSTFLSPFSLNGINGDQVLAYQGTMAAPTFIAGLHWNVYRIANGDPTNTTDAAWDGVVPAGFISASTSEKPVTLTAGTNALWIYSTADLVDPEKGNGRFVCGPDVSTAALIRTAVCNRTNWTVNDLDVPAVGFTLPTGCNYLGILAGPPAFTTHPSNSTICQGTNTSFTIVATGATSYQWQVDQGAGFIDLANDATYSNVTTTTLNITAATIGLNGYLYRCGATNGSGTTFSNAATLTVTPLPVNPTILLKTPATVSIADGTPVSATFNAGSGGTGCTDDYRYTIDGGTSYLPYTPGNNISTTGLAAGTGYVFIEGRRAACASLCQGSYIVLAAWYVTPLPVAATTLNAGDIGFSGYTSTVTDEFSFVLLKNIGPGTVINFTCNGWLSATSALQIAEETVTWTSNAAYPAGTEIKISGLTATLATGASAGTVTGVALSLSTTGDQVLAYRGTAASPTFISAIHMNVYTTLVGDPVTTTAATWDGTANTTNSSALPPGLTTGVNAIWIGTQDVTGSEADNARYGNCAGAGTLGPINTLRAALNNQNNWIKDNLTPPGFTIPTGCLYFGLGAVPSITTPPSPSTVCAGTNTSFSIVAGGAITYQWQVDNGGGFVNLANDATYSGVTSTTLNINATPFSLNGYLYRCVATNVSGSTPSASALLTVNAVPVNPTLNAKTPPGLTVPDGTPVSATFNAGSGGTTCTDDFRYTIDNGASYLPYTPGNNISTTGLAAGSGFVVIEGRRAGCASACQGTYVVLASWNVTPLPAAPTTLNAGDIAFSGYAATTIPDEFSFVLLRNIGPGTVINFTDNGWLSTNVLQSAEQTITWTSPVTALVAGTEIRISGLAATRSGGGAAGTVTGTALSLITGGDQILAYRGTSAAPTFISAIHMNVYSIANGDPVTTTAAAWDGTANTTSSSALPTGLTTGVNAIWIGTQDVISSEFDNARYGNCAAPGVLGPIAALRALLNNQANWIRDNNTPPSFTLPTGCNYLSVLCPAITVTNPVNTAGTAATAFSETFTSSGGAPVVTYSTSSTLPTGLTLSTAGVLSGTPTQAGTFPIVVVATDGNGCTGSGSTYTLVIGCPAPITGIATPASQTLCSGIPITNIVLSGAPAGAVYNWTRDNTVAVTGIAASGAGDISGTLTNTTAAPVTVTFTITPTYYGTCTGTPYTATVLVNPTPNAVATPASQTICSANPITTIVLSGAVSGTVFNWTRDNTVAVTGVAASGSGNISGTLTNTTNAPVTVTFTITPTANGCAGAAITATVLVNPTPNAVATPSSQTICSGAAITAIVLSGNVAGTVYNWTRDNTVAVTGIAASGAGNISGSLTNTTNAPVTVTFTITPTANGCPGAAITATVLVNPTPNAVATPASQTICSGATITTIVLSGNVSGTVFNWTRNNTVTVTGIAASGSGNISGALTNTTALPITVTFTITPTANGCPGTAITATVLVNPTPVALATPSSQTICSGSAITTIVLSSTTPGTTYNWTRDNTIPVTGIAASGSGNISGALTNTTNAPVTVTFTITPTANGCAGAPITATVLVNPAPNAVATPSSQTACSGQTITTIVLSGNVAGTVFNWTRDNTVTVTGIAASGSGNISGALTNTTASAITVTFTVIPTANGCPGAPVTATVLLYPTPDATATPASQTICSANPITTIVLTGTVPATIFNWTRDNVATVTGIAASGSGNISGTLTNTTNVPVIVTFTIIPTANGCQPGVPVTATVLVNPTPVATVPANVTYCNGTIVPTNTLNFTSNVAGTTFTWTNSNTAIGLVASGSGNSLPLFTTQNGTNAPIFGIITVIPTANGCPGAPQTFTITINPIPTVAPVGNQVICNGSPTTTVTFTGAVAGTVYNWTNNTTSIGLAASGTGNIASFNAINATNAPVTATITVTPSYTNGGTTCTGSSTTFTITVNPTATVTVVPNQTVCNGAATATVTFTSPTTGGTIVYNWTNTTTSIGLAASGTGNIASFTATNTTTGPVTATITVTPTYSNGGTNCVGTPRTFTITVNPTATINAVANQVVCNGSPTTAVNFSSPTTGGTIVYNWTNNNATIGLAASGTGNIASFNAINTGTAPVTATITVTPTYSNGGTNCIGTPITFTITVNPTATVNAVANQVVCNGSPTTAVTFSSPTTGGTIVYNWTNNTTSIGLAASGTGNIASFTATNATTAPVTATITVTPTYSNGGTTCVGTPTTFTITVNPTATVTTVANQVVCNASPTTAVTFTSPTTGGTIVYNWTNSLPSIGLAASGTGNIASFTAINTGTAAVTATITVTPTYTNGGTTCVGTPTTFTITVNAFSYAPTGATSSTTVSCGPTTVTLSVVGGSLGTGGSWKWYSGSCGGTLVGTGATLTNIAVNATTTFFVRAEGTCNTTTCASVTVTIHPQPTISIAASSYTSLLPGMTTTLTATIAPVDPLNTIVWYRNGVVVPGASAGTYTVNVDGLGTYTSRVTTIFGCTALSNAVVIKDSVSDRLFITPNPNNGRFKVRYHTGYQSLGFLRNLVVYDSKGAMVYNKAFTITAPYSSMDVNITNAPGGIYFVMITDFYGKQLISGKVTKQ